MRTVPVTLIVRVDVPADEYNGGTTPDAVRDRIQFVAVREARAWGEGYDATVVDVDDLSTATIVAVDDALDDLTER